MATVLKRAAALLVLLVATAPAARAAEWPSVSAALSSRADLSKLAALLKQFPDVAAELDEGFTGTLLAPNNKALSNLRLAAKKADLKLTPALWKKILRYAIVPTVYELRDLQDGWELPTLEGNPITIKYLDGVATFFGTGTRAGIASGPVQQLDVRQGGLGASGNAVIHLLNNVLLPFKLGNGVSLTPGGVVTASGAKGGKQGVSATSISDDATTTAAGAGQAVSGSVQAAVGAVEGAVGSAKDALAAGLGAVTGAAGNAVDATKAAVGGVLPEDVGAVAGAEAPGLAEGPVTAPSPIAAPSPAPAESALAEYAPDPVETPPSSASVKSVQCVVLALAGAAALLL